MKQLVHSLGFLETCVSGKKKLNLETLILVQKITSYTRHIPNTHKILYVITLTILRQTVTLYGGTVVL